MQCYAVLLIFFYDITYEIPITVVGLLLYRKIPILQVQKPTVQNVNPVNSIYTKRFIGAHSFILKQLEMLSFTSMNL